jgi:hypothetical protein
VNLPGYWPSFRTPEYACLEDRSAYSTSSFTSHWAAGGEPTGTCFIGEINSFVGGEFAKYTRLQEGNPL